MYPIKNSTNIYALPITTTKAWEVLCSIRFSHMFRCRFANATHVLLCKSNRQKLESMKKEPNNNHIPQMCVIQKLFSLHHFSQDMKHTIIISARWLTNPKSACNPLSLINFGAPMNILCIIRVKMLVLIKWSYTPPPLR